MTDMGEVELGFTAWEIDHLCDPADDAEALTELLEERIAEVVEREDREPFSRREYREMYARHGQGPERVNPR